MKSLIKNVSRKELLAIAGIIVFVLTASVLPYLYAYKITPPGKEYTGVHYLDSYDTYTYLAWIEQGREGHILFKELYTAEPQPVLLLHPVFLTVGLFARVTNLSNIQAYHVARVVAGALFLAVLYIFISLFVIKPYWRILAFVIAATSSGMGILFGGSSTDLFMPETINFLSIYESVLNTFSLALILVLFILVIRKFGQKSLKPVLLGALLLNIITLTHTYDFILVAFIVGIYCLLKSYSEKNISYLRNVFYLALFSFPAILWQAFVLTKNTNLAIWATIQSNVPAYSPYNYLTGYGFLLVFAIPGVVYAWKSKVSEYFLLCIWVVVSVILLYLPYLAHFQRKFTEGLHIPIAILASFGIIWWIDLLAESSRKQKVLLSVFLVIYLSLSNLSVINDDIGHFQGGGEPYYFQISEMDAVRWLKYNTQVDDVILSELNISNIIPGISGRTVYLGHMDQTANYTQKSDTLQKIFARPNLPASILSSFLAENRINYILVDQQMRNITSIDFSSYPFLVSAYTQGQTQIYQVNLK